jgi:superfamily II DNA/RNA helicase
MTYRDFRFDDALTVLEDIEEVQDRSSLEILLNAVHKGLMDKLTTLPKVPNPLLVHMESILLEQYLRNPQSKGIFFVRAIKHTKYVTSWIKSSSALSRIIRAAPITGHSRGGMEQSEQLRVLDAFRTGAYNLLASTSVLEEGLDVPECNYVIRYQNVSNEIAQVQAKGRARAENSRMYTVVSTHSNRRYWYLVQEEKQRIVKISIPEMNLATLGQQIPVKQQSFVEERDHKVQQMKILRSTWQHPEKVEVRCKNCKEFVCKGSDIFTYSMRIAYPHYIVPSKTFTDKYEQRAHDKPEISEDFVKPYNIYCRSVNCRNQWGVIGLWRETGFKFPVIKCEKFLFKYHGATQRFRKWRDIWFEVHSIQDWVEFEDDILDN